MSETKIDKIDFLAAFLYVGIGAFIWWAYIYSILPQEDINKLLLALTFAGPVGLFLIYYKRLRIKEVTVLWLMIGILQLIVVNEINSNPDFKSVAGTYADNHMNLLAMILLVTVFRIISILITRQEFMVAAWFSPRDNRKPNILDYTLTFIGFLVLTVGISLI